MLSIDQPEYRAFLKAEGQPSMLASVDKMEQPTSAYTGISRAPNKYHPVRVLGGPDNRVPQSEPR